MCYAALSECCATRVAFLHFTEVGISLEGVTVGPGTAQSSRIAGQCTSLLSAPPSPKQSFKGI